MYRELEELAIKIWVKFGVLHIFTLFFIGKTVYHKKEVLSIKVVKGAQSVTFDEVFVFIE